MKCISLWQPWATLIAHGFKRFETRSWPTKHRGPIAIHASKRWNRPLADICLSDPFGMRLSQLRPNEGGAFYLEDALTKILPLGCVVAVAELTDCIEMSAVSMRELRVSAEERCFGDWADGRYAFKLENVRRLTVPMPLKGLQGIFNIDDIPARALVPEGTTSVPNPD